MDAKECIITRRSVRDFTEEPITEAVLTEIVEAASFAPSWKNTQVVRYNVVHDREKLRYIAEECVLGFAGNTHIINGCADLVVVSHVNARSGFERDGSFTTTKGDRWQMFDAGIAAQTFCLAAWDKGIGSVIMGIMDEEKIARCIDLPENETVAALIAIGYPAQIGPAPKRKPADQLLRIL